MHLVVSVGISESETVYGYDTVLYFHISWTRSMVPKTDFENTVAFLFRFLRLGILVVARSVSIRTV